jgi:alginate O-acetyltransferase complex protein AlgI
MSFASALFLLGFLPLVLIGFWLPATARRAGRSQAWLLLASFGFYAASGWSDFCLLLVSLALNLGAGRVLLARRQADPDPARGRPLLALAIGANVLLLFGYKLHAAQAGASMFLSGASIAIPLGLSFITFQQIAFLLDCHRGRIARVGTRDYLLFITFFPQLVMGPIVHFRDLVPQFAAGRLEQRVRANLLLGLSIFAVGLFKKLVVADSLAGPVDAIFAAAGRGGAVSMLDAWAAAIGFQLQLFLDFSGYADMAIGLAKMFNIDLPINYDDPFHARNRFDLWRRWHLTFVEFMRTHVFQPLARIRGMPLWLALTLTGVASGLWHGLGWTFLVWGLLQTVLLMLSHAWSRFRRSPRGAWLPRSTALQILLTFLVTAAVGVLFRSSSLGVAGEILAAMLSPERLQWPLALQRALPWLAGADVAGEWSAPLLEWGDGFWFGLAAALVWLLPQTRQLFGPHWTALDPRPRSQRGRGERAALPLRFRFSFGWGLAVGLLLLAALACLGQAQRFVYFQF